MNLALFSGSVLFAVSVMALLVIAIEYPRFWFFMFFALMVAA